jgi:hypothetical protein
MAGKLDRQWAFDTALNGLRAQGRRSVGPNGVTCLYRGLDNTKCGVGFLIPDERYTKALDEGEDAGAADLPIVQEAVCPGGMSDDDGEFLYRLQRELHDDHSKGDFRAELEKGAQKLADLYGLTYAVPAEQVSA